VALGTEGHSDPTSPTGFISSIYKAHHVHRKRHATCHQNSDISKGEGLQHCYVVWPFSILRNCGTTLRTRGCASCTYDTKHHICFDSVLCQ